MSTLVIAGLCYTYNDWRDGAYATTKTHDVSTSTHDTKYIRSHVVPVPRRQKLWCFMPLLCTLFRLNRDQADAGDNEAKLMSVFEL